MIRVFEMKDTFVAVPVRCLIRHLSPTRVRASKMTRGFAIMAKQRVFLVISTVTDHAWPIVMNGHILQENVGEREERRWVLLKVPRCDIDGVGEGK